MTDKAIFTNFNGLDVLSAQYRRQTFSRHVHEGYTMALIHDGAQRFDRLNSGYIAGRGSMVLINADQVHTGQALTEGGWCYRAIYPTPEMIENICGGVFRCAVPYFPSAVIDDPSTARHFSAFFQSVSHENPQLQSETLLHGAIIELVSRHGKKHQEPHSALSHPLNHIREYLHAYFSEEIGLEALARLAGLSTFQLVRQFKKQTGLAPHAYQVQLRIRHAQQLLKAGVSIADVAVDAGFHDQSHLHRHFKRALGVTPGQYRHVYS